jgi:hypothetical protein
MMSVDFLTLIVSSSVVGNGHLLVHFALFHSHCENLSLLLPSDGLQFFGLNARSPEYEIACVNLGKGCFVEDVENKRQKLVANSARVITVRSVRIALLSATGPG